MVCFKLGHVCVCEREGYSGHRMPALLPNVKLPLPVSCDVCRVIKCRTVALMGSDLSALCWYMDDGSPGVL